MMSASDELYRFDVAGLPDSTFTVLSFQAQETVSQPSWTRIVAVSQERGLDHEEMVGKDAVLTVHVNGTHLFQGVVTEFNEEPSGDKLSRYEIVVRDRLILMELASHCRVFQDMRTPEILEALLKPYGIEGRGLRNLLRKNYDRMELRVQYNESDLDFFQRIAEASGVFHFGINEGSDRVLVLAEDNSGFPPSGQDDPMEYRPGAGMVESSFEALFSLRRTNRIHTGKVRVLGYDYENPSTPLRGQADGPGEGEWVRFDSDIRTLSQASEQSRFLREARRVVRDQIQGTSHNPWLRCGEKFMISQTQGAGFGGEYVLLEVFHEGCQEGSVLGHGQDNHYRNTFMAQPCAMPYRPSPTGRRPVVSGVIVAKVDGPDGPYAHLDSQGRYRARLPFDESEAAPGLASPPIRMSQPYAGPNHGLHMPLHKGADLVLAFEDGDIDRPIALGSVPNPSQGSPVSGGNKTESVLKTASGNVLKLDDLAGKTYILLQTAAGRKLHMDDGPGAGILLETPHKHRLHLDDKGNTLQLSTGNGTHSLDIEHAKGILTLKTKSGHVLQLDDEAKAMSLQSANGHSFKLDDAAGILTIQDSAGKHKIQIDASGKISLTTEGDMEFQAKGSLSMKAADVSIESTKGAVQVKAAKALDMQAMNATLKTTQKLSVDAGTDAELKAKMNLKMEGTLNVESKAGVANKLIGTTTSVEGTVSTTIKGAMVMLN